LVKESFVCLSQRVYKQYFFIFSEYCSLDEMALFGSLYLR
jgi:hypothetical protein